MYKVAAKKHARSNSDYDLYGDLEKIKAAFAETRDDMKGKAAEMFTQSLDNLKNETANIQARIGDFTSERPMKTIGVSLLAGFVLGFIFRK
jgi:ElaB/YqjD/DUF883 family membrane-anchored ribosome-binding protein